MRIKLLPALLVLGFQIQAQSDLVVGSTYNLNLQRQNAHADAWILHNAEYSNGNDILKWETTSTNFGMRGIRLGYSTGRGIYFYAQEGATTAGVDFTPTTRFFIGNDGKLGVGTTAPTDRFHIAGDGFVNLRVGRWATLGETGSGIATILGNNIRASHTTNNLMEFITTTSDGGKAIKMQYSEGISFHTFQGNVTANAAFTGYERMRIDNNGNVGIGTTNPDAKLAVKGTIHAQEVKVDLSIPGPDYVFEKDYALMSLKEIKAYIEKHKHLPEVPSAKEMETNGVNLSEMNMILLKKVEELTLHVIKLEDTNKFLIEENEKQNKLLDKGRKKRRS